MEPEEISWFYGMGPADVCVTPGPQVQLHILELICPLPGTTVIFQWDSFSDADAASVTASTGHNVNSGLSAEDFSSCSGLTDADPALDPGPPYYFYWEVPTTTGNYYFADGVEGGLNCKNGGMKANVTVNDACKL